MPYIILKARDISRRNSFMSKCGGEGFIPVIGTIRRGKIDIDADVNALGGEYEDLRQRLQDNSTPVFKIFESVLKRMQPKHTWNMIGYYSSINGLNREGAEEVAVVLAEELDALMIKMR